MTPASLLEAVSGLLERTYDMRSVPGELWPFLIGDRGWRALYATSAAGARVDSAQRDGAQTLLRETASGLRACVYFPDAMILALEADPPQRGLHDGNLAAFATFVEEIDHLLVVAERFGQGRPVSLFELELHANVSKHLVLARFLAGARGRLSAAQRTWLWRGLYGGLFCDEDARVRQRYDDARRYALRLIDGLARLARGARLDLLRRFHRGDGPGKVELIERLVA